MKNVLIEYQEYLPIKTVQLNWAELRQMQRSKLNKQSSLLGDSTMVIRASCELPFIIYGSAVGCLQLNKPTVHWLGTLQREGELKMALFPLEEVHFHLNEGGSPKCVVLRPLHVWNVLTSFQEASWHPSTPCSRVISTETLIYTCHQFTGVFAAACLPWCRLAIYTVLPLGCISGYRFHCWECCFRFH